MVAVCHPDGPDASGKIFELGAGYIAEVRWERSNGTIFKTDSTFTPTAVRYVAFLSKFFVYTQLSRLKPSGIRSSTSLNLISEFLVSDTLRSRLIHMFQSHICGRCRFYGV